MPISRARRANPEARMELRAHLLELRNRIVKAALGVLLGAVAGWFLYHPVFNALAQPLLDEAHKSGRTVAPNFSSVGGGFDMQVRMSTFIGILVSSPIWIYQLWAFITPGLTRRERRYALAFMFSAVPLFLAGASLAYAAMGNFVRFFIDFTPQNATNIINVDVYLDFVMRMMLSFGLSFLLPVVLVALNLIGILPGRRILKSWRWVVVASFTFAAIATPTPDVMSMFILALPLLGLFAIAIAITLVSDRRREKRRLAKEAELEREITSGVSIGAPEPIEAPGPVVDPGREA